LSTGRVINTHNRDKFTIEKYKFRSSDDFSFDDIDSENGDDFVSLTQSLGLVNHEDSSAQYAVQENSNTVDITEFGDESQHHDEPTVLPDSQTIELLYKKIEEFSDKVVKLEMALEAKDAEFEAKLKTANDESYHRGYQACSDELAENYTRELDEKQKMISSSITKLETAADTFTKKLEDIQKELVTTALAISSEVIKIELSNKSSEIALTLAKELMAKLYEASSVNIKVNSEDFALLNANLGDNSKVTLEVDDAIAKGGVIVMSSMGNFDGSIASRLEKVIKEATNK